MTDETAEHAQPTPDIRVIVHRLQLAANAAALLRAETAELREVLRRRRRHARRAARLDIFVSFVSS